MYTDPKHLKITDPDQIEGNAMFTYLDAFHTEPAKVAEMKVHYQRGGLGDRQCKNEIETCLQTLLAQIRQCRAELIANPGYLMAILKAGTVKAYELTQQTLLEVKKAFGLPIMF